MRHNPDFKHIQINLIPFLTAAQGFCEKPETHQWVQAPFWKILIGETAMLSEYKAYTERKSSC